MRHHLLPVRAKSWVLLHRLAQELKAAKADLDVLWPRPRSFFHFTVKELQGHLVRSLFFHVEDEHSGQHLVEYNSNRPHIDLMAITLSASPVRLNLLSRHH